MVYVGPNRRGGGRRGEPARSELRVPLTIREASGGSCAELAQQTRFIDL